VKNRLRRKQRASAAESGGGYRGWRTRRINVNNEINKSGVKLRLQKQQALAYNRK